MKREQVYSTTLASIGYDKLKQVLEVQFMSGNIYRYFYVPYKQYRELIKADSIGAYFNYYIKQFPFVKIR